MVLKLYLSGCQNPHDLKFLHHRFRTPVFGFLGHLLSAITLSGCLNDDNLIGENC